MRYSVAIHKDENSCFGIPLPDIRGCFSAGDTLENVKEAINTISRHLEILADDGILAPEAFPIKALNQQSKG